MHILIKARVTPKARKANGVKMRKNNLEVVLPSTLTEQLFMSALHSQSTESWENKASTEHTQETPAFVCLTQQKKKKKGTNSDGNSGSGRLCDTLRSLVGVSCFE